MSELTQQTLDELLLPSTITPEQRAAVTADGGTLLLSASAGSGKTFVLSSRVVYKLAHREKEVRADRLLVVTFTRAAAKEMRTRITSRLDELVARFPDDAKLQRQKLLLSRAKITTIDSFCADLVRDHFDQLGLSPDFRIADETELGQVRDEVIDELFEEYYAAQDEAFAGLSDSFSLKDDAKLKAVVLSLYTRIRSNPFPLEWLSDSLRLYSEATELDTTPWGFEIRAQAVRAIAYCAELYRRGFDFTESNPVVYSTLENYHRTALGQLNALLEELDGCGWDEARALLKAFKFPRKPSKKPEGFDKALSDEEDERFLKPARSAVNNLTKELLNCSEEEFWQDVEQQRPVFEKLYEVVERFTNRMDERKREKNILDFPDLGIFAVQLLLKRRDGGLVPTPLGEAVSGELDEILVDEFQDVNQLQDMLFRAVSRQETNLFLVGDIKQSIYRFRQASPEIFLEKRGRFSDFSTGSYPARLTLAENFRSRPEVTGCVNYLFRQLMSEQLGELDYGEGEELRAAAAYPAHPAAQAELHLLDTALGDSDDGRIAAEANYIGRKILSMLRAGYPVTGEDGNLRPCNLSDFAILLRSKKDKAEVYAEQLMRLGLDVWTENTSGYFRSREVSLMLNLLRVIDNPLQDIPLLSVLLSPMYGFTPDELAEIRVADRRAPLYLCLTAGESEKSRAFVQSLDRLREAAAVTSVEKLIQKIYDETLFYALFGAMESSEQKLANLRLLLSYAAGYEKGSGRGLSGFLRYIDAAEEANRDFECANIFTENSSAVRILTMHKSKGLEFPICFVANCAGRFNQRDLSAPFCISPRLGFAMKLTVPALLKQYATLPYLAAQLENKRALLSEEMRVLYVAMTRAKEKLILTIAADDLQQLVQKASVQVGEGEKLPFYPLYNARSYAEWILMGLLRHPDAGALREYAGCGLEPLPPASRDALCPLRIFINEEEAESGRPDAANRQAEVDEEAYGRLCDNLRYRYPHAALSEIPAKLSVTQIAERRHSAAITRRPRFEREQGLTPAERGTATHQFIQFADFARAAEDLEAEIVRLCSSGFLDQQQADAIDRRGLAALFHSPLAGRIRAARRVYRELDFFYELDAGEVFPEQRTEGEAILVQGIADCVLDEGETLAIIDYKTDRAAREQIASRYRSQLALYKRAVEAMFGKPVSDCILYAVSLGCEIIL